MEIVLEVPDKDVARVLELIKGIKRVKVKVPQKTNDNGANALLVQELREAGEDLARLRKGEKVSRPAHELLTELKHELQD